MLRLHLITWTEPLRKVWILVILWQLLNVMEALVSGEPQVKGEKYYIILEIFMGFGF